jgi:hypothetical protein
MGATLNCLRDAMVTDRTPHDVGLVLTITVKAYDNGMISVGDHPINRSPDYDSAQG